MLLLKLNFDICWFGTLGCWRTLGVIVVGSFYNIDSLGVWLVKVLLIVFGDCLVVLVFVFCLVYVCCFDLVLLLWVGLGYLVCVCGFNLVWVLWCGLPLILTFFWFVLFGLVLGLLLDFVLVCLLNFVLGFVAFILGWFWWLLGGFDLVSCHVILVCCNGLSGFVTLSVGLLGWCDIDCLV